MRWETEFWKPVTLIDGRIIATLADARDVILTLPLFRQRKPEWLFASELLEVASEASSLTEKALTQLLRALKAEELI
jgi:hypothetical protein